MANSRADILVRQMHLNGHEEDELRIWQGSAAWELVGAGFRQDCEQDPHSERPSSPSLDHQVESTCRQR